MVEGYKIDVIKYPIIKAIKLIAAFRDFFPNSAFFLPLMTGLSCQQNLVFSQSKFVLGIMNILNFLSDGSDVIQSSIEMDVISGILNKDTRLKLPCAKSTDPGRYVILSYRDIISF